jgi:uncharacterized protein
MTVQVLRRCKSFVLPLLACALLAPAVYAWTPNVPAATSTPVKVPPRPLLWKVSDKDNALYLLGSFHLLKADDYPLSSDVEQAFAESEKVVFEVPPSDLMDPATAQKLQTVAGYGDERKLSTVLPAEVREKLGLMLGADRIVTFDAFEPWFINLSLLMGVSQQMGFQADQGLDQHLMQRAAAANKPTAGLESIDEQLRILDSTPMNEQIAGLQDFLDNPTEVPEMLREMHDAWRNADIDRLNALANDEMRNKTPETYRLINVERNDAWLPQLQQMLDKSKRGDTMVVVGAMHLLGSDGVVEKLRAKGYKVERICSACDVK